MIFEAWNWTLENLKLKFEFLRFEILDWNLKFETLRLGLWNLIFWKMETWNFENLWFEILNMNFEVWNFCNLKFWGFWILKIGHLECGILNLGMKILNWKFGIWVLKKKFEIWDLRFEKEKKRKKLEIWTWSFILNRFQKICYQFSLFFLKIYSSSFMMWFFRSEKEKEMKRKEKGIYVGAEFWPPTSFVSIFFASLSFIFSSTINTIHLDFSSSSHHFFSIKTLF